MKGMRLALQRAAIFGVVSVQLFFYPAVIFAQEAPTGEPSETETSLQESQQPPASEPETPPAEEQQPPAQQQIAAPTTGASNTGPTAPNGAGSGGYTFNSDAGVWENEYYTWDPDTKSYVAKGSQDPVYNPDTGTWETTEWVYAPELGTYIARPIAASSINQTGSGSSNGIAGFGGGNFGISNTGAGSMNGIDNQGSFNALINLLFNGSISNAIDSTSTSGNALVQGNTKAGDALTGDASAIANVLNMLQSSWLGQSGNIGGFVANIDGDVVGDLVVDPSHIAYGGLPPNTDIDINVDENGVIDNDINLVATSGNATLDSNSEAGNAETGDAHALANILNMINSGIVADHSFIGMLNIFGDLNGDIYLPSGILDRALIANTGADSNNQISENCQDNNQEEERDPVCNTLDVTTNATKTINNNVTTDAGSGSAILDGNTKAGSASSGGATTNVNTANLVGQNVSGRNALLVFVNVMGHWMGFFYNPSGQAAITNTGANSDNTITSDANRSVSLNANQNSLINNDINVSAHSGDAVLSRNTIAGNARTGDATADVNIFNMIDSQVNVDDFFGVLFINIFGDWFGSFGADTAAGNAMTAQGGMGGGTSQVSSASSQTSSPAPNPLAAFVFFNNQANAGQGSQNSSSGAVAGESSTMPPAAAAPARAATNSSASSSSNNAMQLILVSSLVLALLIGGFAFLDNRYFIVDRLLA